jgi:hypothetical protein
MRYLTLVSIGLLFCGCISTNYEQLATQAGVRVATVNGELAKIARSSRLTAQDRAHYSALLDEAARKLQIEANRELDLRKALAIKEYPLFVTTLLDGADRSAAAIEGLAAQREKMERDIQAEYQTLVLHAQELSASAKALGQLGVPRSGTATLDFLFGFAMDVAKAYSEASANAKTAQDTASKQTVKKSQVLSILSTLASRDNQPGAPDVGSAAPPAATATPSAPAPPSAPAAPSTSRPSLGTRIATCAAKGCPTGAPPAALPTAVAAPSANELLRRQQEILTKQKRDLAPLY